MTTDAKIENQMREVEFKWKTKQNNRRSPKITFCYLWIIMMTTRSRRSTTSVTNISIATTATPTVAAKIMAAFFLSLAVIMLASSSSSSSYSSIFVTDAFTTPTSTTTTASLTVTKRRQGISVNPALTVLDVTARNGLIYEDIEIGTGRNIFPGDSILCYYEGAYYGEKKGGDSKTGLPFFSGLPGGTKKIIFDATDPGEPAEIVIGVGGVIPGWEIGICGENTLDIPPMKIGGDRKLIIPSELAYGPTGTGDGTIPPNTPLEFQISILNAERKSSGISTDTKIKGFAGLVGFLAFMSLIGFVVFSQVL